MTTYQVLFTTGASTVVEVEADSPEEARELADEKFKEPMLCAQCSGWGNRQNLELGDGWEQDESDGGVWSA
jgi:hypothetical protein